MKLSDLNRVSELTKERDYIHALIGAAGHHFRMKLGNHEIRPDLKEKLVLPMTEVFKAEVRRIDGRLLDLGVEVGGSSDLHVTGDYRPVGGRDQ